MLKKVSGILDDIAALNDGDTELLVNALDHGMWDEWDVSLVGGLSMFGATEIRVAAKSAASFAKYIESGGK